MKRDDVKILQEVQKSAKMSVKTIDRISSKVYDDDLSMQMAKEAIKYSEIYNKATKRLVEGKAPVYRDSGFQDLMLKGIIETNTLFNTSTGHLAEVMIQGVNKGLTGMWKAVNHHGNAGKETMEIAKELMDFEEKNVERLKLYL